MSVPERPGTLYRAAVRQLLFRYAPAAGGDADLQLLDHLEQQYAEERRTLAAAEAAGAPEPQLTATRSALFVFSVGLLAFGRIERARDVIDYMPSSGSVRRLALALAALLPLPRTLDPLRAPEAVRTWLMEHGAQLRWDETRGCYVEPQEPSG